MPLCVFLVVEERIEEVCSRGRLGFRPHGHSLYVFLERFVFSTVFLMASFTGDAPALLPSSGSLPLGVAGRVAFAHGRYNTGKRVHEQGFLAFRMVSGCEGGGDVVGVLTLLVGGVA